MPNLFQTDQADSVAKQQLLCLYDALSAHHKTQLMHLSNNLYLSLINDQLSLHWRDGRFSPFTLDYRHSDVFQHHTAKRSLLAKACQAKKKPIIWDLTCGWGYDSAVLAQAGALVTSFEEQPLVGLMVQYAKNQLKAIQWQTYVAQAETVLKQTPTIWPDILYLDPMFPEKPKGRLPQKRMQILMQLCDTSDSAATLLAQAMATPVTTIVLKQPRKQAAIIPEHHRIIGKSVQWRIYHRSA